ncbi:hypothetical protein MJG53_003853 [Ovis ammon polii x Ovis aries]|uniref:Uncharacterized protein n=1 Tax=Ovis ammon polii x Ovis aries TaxID=2918886 RepID=A0ACB9V811_9CETA|nr:hypothetical protein MJG53_003853 [Ovis ammon polii x Ovis aries]
MTSSMGALAEAAEAGVPAFEVWGWTMLARGARNEKDLLEWPEGKNEALELRSQELASESRSKHNASITLTQEIFQSVLLSGPVWRVAQEESWGRLELTFRVALLSCSPRSRNHSSCISSVIRWHLENGCQQSQPAFQVTAPIRSHVGSVTHYLGVCGKGGFVAFSSWVLKLIIPRQKITSNPRNRRALSTQKMNSHCIGPRGGPWLRTLRPPGMSREGKRGFLSNGTADPLALDTHFRMSGTRSADPGRHQDAPGGLICKSCFNYLEMISSVALKPKRLGLPPLVENHKAAVTRSRKGEN